MAYLIHGKYPTTAAAPHFPAHLVRPLATLALLALAARLGAQTPEPPTPPPGAGGTEIAAATTIDDPFAAYFAKGMRRNVGASGVRWGAYGELHYNNTQGKKGAADKLDFHRFILLTEYDFSDTIRFFSEVEIEHAFIQEGQGELELEQAYLDFAIHEGFNVHVGILPVPISIGNLYHEPPFFHGVERPTVEKVIVPTTWFESGFGIHGQLGESLGYVLDVVGGLKGENFRAKDGIRAGRQKAFETVAEDFIVAGRLDYRPRPGLWLAAGMAAGNNNQGAPIGTANLVLYTLEVRWTHKQLELGATWAQGRIDDPQFIQPDTGKDPVPKTFEGFYVQAAYDVLPHLAPQSSQKLQLFARHESFDTQAEVPAGYTANPGLTGTALTVGVTYRPDPRVVVKFDYQDFDNDADSAEDKLNLGIGFMF